MKRIVCIVIISSLLLVSSSPTTLRSSVHTTTPIETTDTPLIIPTSTMTAPGEERCPLLSPGFPEDAPPGRLIVFDHDQEKLVAVDLADGERSAIIPPTEQALSYAFSADGKWLAYESQSLDGVDKRLIIANDRGEPMLERPWLDRWFKLAYWVNPEWLIIQMSPDTGGSSTAGNYDRLILYNPYTAGERMLINQFPELHNPLHPKNWKGAGQTIYDPTLERAVFAGLGGSSYVLGNMMSNVILAEVKTFSLWWYPGSAPQWSPDGQYALVSALNAESEYVFEMYALQRDGSIVQLTHFIDFYPSIGIERYSWSPNGKSIAFLYSSSTDRYYPERLAMMDFDSHALVLYCFQGDVTQLNYRNNLKYYYDEQVYAGVVWSPDGSWIILENRFAENASNIILLNPENNLAYMLIEKENVQPIGWMVNP
jgi:WD40 repeat protein